MVGAVVQKVAAAAPGCQVCIAVAGWIVLAVCAGKDHLGHMPSVVDLQRRWSCYLVSIAIIPAVGVEILPAAVWEGENARQVRAPALLASAAGDIEAYALADGSPIVRIERAQLGPYRHLVFDRHVVGVRFG